MATVGQILRTKGHDVWSIRPDATVFECLELMAEKNIGAVLVVENENLIGIFSERDYARKVILKGRSSKETMVKETMSENVITVTPNKRLEECMSLMTDQRIRHLPVLDGGKLIGLISIGDVVKKIISKQKDTIRELENYITGSV